MRPAIRHSLAWALALPFLALPLSAHPGHDCDHEEHHEESHEAHEEHHGKAHEKHHGEGQTCPMVAEAEKAAMSDVLADLDRSSKKLIALAEAIPADKYGWAPSEEVRSVSEVFMHVVGTNLLLPPAIGAAPPEGVDMAGNPFETMQKWEDEITEKDAVIEKLNESFAYVEGALRSLEGMDMNETIELFGPLSRRSYVLIVLTHTHEHLGQSIAYARSLGVTPPWSRQQAEGETEGGEG